uniref:Uncharacterized protein n=1 Tax=Arundo donax TaxID=35708 RepID=A0A0A9FJZ4_ARUDO
MHVNVQDGIIFPLLGHAIHQNIVQNNVWTATSGFHVSQKLDDPVMLPSLQECSNKRRVSDNGGRRTRTDHLCQHPTSLF